MDSITEAVAHTAVDDHLLAAFQLMTLWASALPDGLCNAPGPISRALLAAFAIVAAERDQRIRIIDIGHYARDLFWYDSYRAAERIIAWAENLWVRSERRERKITIVRVAQLVLAERKSRRMAAEELNVSERAVLKRYRRCLEVVDEAGIKIKSGVACYNDNRKSESIDSIIAGWQKRLAMIDEPAGWQNDEIGLEKRVTPRERRLPSRPKPKVRPLINIWFGFSKAAVREAAEPLIQAYLTNGGAITIGRPGNCVAQGYWESAGRRSSPHASSDKPKLDVAHRSEVECFLAGDRRESALRYRDPPKPEPLFDDPEALVIAEDKIVVVGDINDNGIFASSKSQIVPLQDKVTSCLKPTGESVRRRMSNITSSESRERKLAA